MSAARRRFGDGFRPAAPAQRRRHLIDRAADAAAPPAGAPANAPANARRKRKPRFVL